MVWIHWLHQHVSAGAVVLNCAINTLVFWQRGVLDTADMAYSVRRIAYSVCSMSCVLYLIPCILCKIQWYGKIQWLQYALYRI